MPITLTVTLPLSKQERAVLAVMLDEAETEVVSLRVSAVVAKALQQAADIGVDAPDVGQFIANPSDAAAMRKAFPSEDGKLPFGFVEVSKLTSSTDAPDPAKVFGASPAQQPADSASVQIPPPPVPGALVAPPPTAVSALPDGPAATPAGSASSTGAANAPAPTNALDAKGFPWDNRIHATTKTKNADGTWRQKRGVAPELIVSVEAELKALMAIPAPAATTGVIPPPPGVAMTFGQFVEQLTEWQVNKGLTLAEHILPTIRPMGIESLLHLRTREDLIPGVHAALKALVDKVPA